MENKETFSKKEIENIYRMKNEIEDLIKTKELFEYYIVSSPTATDKFTKHSYRSHPSFVIAGGVFASIFHKEEINDIDVFILGEHHIIHSEDWITPNYDAFSTLIRYKEGRWNVQFRLDEDDNYHNPHVFGTATHKESGIQYIMTDHLTRQDLLKDFDFVHCTVSYHEGKLNINRGAYDAIANKHLVPQNRKKKIKQWRQDKFIGRGWSDHTNPDYKLITIFDKAIERAMAQKSAEIRKEYEWPVYPQSTSSTITGAELDEKAWKELFEKDKEKWKMKTESALANYWTDILQEE